MCSAANTWPRAKTVASASVQFQALPVGNPAPPNFASTAYQTMPSTSSCEEIAPMDPAPSKVSFFKLFIVIVP